MKKFLFVFLLLLMSFSLVNVNAATKDVTGPTIKSLKLKKSTFKPGESVTIDLDAVDDISGVHYLELRFCDPTKDCLHDLNAVISLYYNINSEGKGTYSEGKILKTIDPGKYVLEYALISDYEWNSTRYITNENQGVFNEKTYKIASKTITVEKASQVVYPEIESFKIDKLSGIIGEEVKLSVKVKNPDIIKQILIFYDKHGFIEPKRVGNTAVYEYMMPLKKAGTYYFGSIHLRSEDDVESEYTYKNDNSEATGVKKYRIFENGSYNIDVSGEVDTGLPTLKSVKFKKESFIIPSVVEFTIDAYDNIKNNIENIGIDVYKVGAKNPLIASPTCKGIDHNYICKFEINQYVEEGTYEIREIDLHDGAGNWSIYRTDGIHVSEPAEVSTNGTYSKYYKLNEYKFELKKDLESDIITSTIAEDMLSKIDNSSKDAKISIDCSKNSIIPAKAFELIKGTNRKIYVETNGITWIFHGKNIVSKNIKDVDVSVSMKFVETNKRLEEIFGKALIINFQDNGLLPGLAKIRIKGDYTFRNYIGVENLKVYYDNNNMFDIISSDVWLTKDGYYEFYILHNSRYVLTDKKLESKYISKNEEKKLTNDKLNKNNNKKVQTSKKKTTTTNKVTITDSTTKKVKGTKTTSTKTTEKESSTTLKSELISEPTNLEESEEVEKEDTVLENVSKKEKTNLTKIVLISLISIIIVLIILVILFKNKIFKKK